MKFDLGINNETKTDNSQKEKVSSYSTIKLNEFFNELITARNLKIKIDEKLLAEFENFIEDKLIPVFMNDEIFNLEEQPEILRWLDNSKYAFLDLIQKPYLNNKLIIAVAGRYSAGKSSFLNSILNTNLPVDVEATTAIPTYLTYFNELHKEMNGRFNSDGKYMLVSSVFGNKLMQTKLLDKITKENVKDFPVPLNTLIKFFVLSNKHSLLTNKVIIDTPGIDPSDKKGFDYDEKITEEALSLANIVFWVMDVDDGELGRISTEFLEKNIKEEQDLIIIINKIDKKPPKEIQKVIDKVKKTVNEKNIKAKTIMVVPFSKKDKKLIKEIINYIIKIPVTKTTPFIVELIDVYLDLARQKVVNKIIETKNYIEYLENKIKQLIKINTFNREEFYQQLDIFEQKYDNNENMLKSLKDIKTYHNNVNYTYNEILNILEFDSPIFGDDKYYFPKWKYQTFTNKLNNLAVNSSEFSSHIWNLIGYNNCLKIQEQSKLEQLEKLEDKINEAINKFDELKIKLKKLI